MTPADRDGFARGMAVLSVVFDRYRLTEDQQALRAAAYFEALSDVHLDEIEAAIRRWRDTGHNFPVPVDLREEIGRARRARQRALAAEEREQRMLLPATEAERRTTEEAKAGFAALVRRLTARFTAPARRPHWTPEQIRDLHADNARAAASDSAHQARLDQVRQQARQLGG